MTRHRLFHSGVRTDAVILEALVIADPSTISFFASQNMKESPLIPKLIKGLLDVRRDGRWNNTQENLWVTIALDRYFNVFEKEKPDFTARIWLNDEFCGEIKYQVC